MTDLKARSFWKLLHQWENLAWREFEAYGYVTQDTLKHLHRMEEATLKKERALQMKTPASSSFANLFNGGQS